MRYPLRSPVLALGLALILSFAMRAQDRPKPPIFKARTEVVLVDFVVSDKTNRLVRDHSTFPISDAEAIAAARGDPQMLARLTSRFTQLNPSLSRDQAEALAHSRSIEVAYDARMRRELVYGVALLSLDWLAGQPGRHSLVMVSGGFAPIQTTSGSTRS